MIIIGDAEHGHAIAELSGGFFNPAIDVVIARMSGEKLLGGVIYQNYNVASICIHMGGFDSHWVSKDMLWVAFHYPFNQLKCERMFGQVPSTNIKSLELQKRLGFHEVTRVRGVFEDGDLVVMAMERADCRWLNLRKEAA